MKTLKERLIFARELRKLTQADLAKKAKCAQSAIGNVESGTRHTLRNLVLVARALRVSADWLFDGKGPEPDVDERNANWANAVISPRRVITANESGISTIDDGNYDPYTMEVIYIMARLSTNHKAAALARLKEFTNYLAPPDHGQALPMAG